MYRTNINRFTTFNVHSSLGGEDISETAVDAGHGFTIVKVDVDSGVAFSSTTSVTGDLKVILVSTRQRLKYETYHSLVDSNGRNLLYQVNGPLVVNLFLEAGDGKPHIARVFL